MSLYAWLSTSLSWRRGRCVSVCMVEYRPLGGGGDVSLYAWLSTSLSGRRGRCVSVCMVEYRPLGGG